MAKFYQGMVMAAIVLSAGIIGQFDSADERSIREEIYADAVRHDPSPDQHQSSLDAKTAMLRPGEAGNHYP